MTKSTIFTEESQRKKKKKKKKKLLFIKWIDEHQSLKHG